LLLHHFFHPPEQTRAALYTQYFILCTLDLLGQIVVFRWLRSHHQPTFNLLAPEFYISILAHTVCKVWIIQEPKKVALWNKRRFEEKNGDCAACLKYSVLIFVEKIYKMQHLEGSGTPVLYIGRTVFKG
jgi:hypothetical protein